MRTFQVLQRGGRFLVLAFEHFEAVPQSEQFAAGVPLGEVVAESGDLFLKQQALAGPEVALRLRGGARALLRGQLFLRNPALTLRLRQLFPQLPQHHSGIGFRRRPPAAPVRRAGHVLPVGAVMQASEFGNHEGLRAVRAGRRHPRARRIDRDALAAVRAGKLDHSAVGYHRISSSSPRF